MAKWLDKYEQGGQVLKKKTKDNYGKKPNPNNVEASVGPNYVGQGYDITGRNYSPAWGGQFQNGGFLQPTSSKLPEGYVIPYNTPSTELAMSIGGEKGEPAYLIPSFKGGKKLKDPIAEFKKTGEHLGGPFKTWQEAEKFGEMRHQYVEKGQDIPTPLKTWGDMAMGGSLPGAVGFTYARVAGAAPSNGKYAKKTKASAQNGEALPAPRYNAQGKKYLFDNTDPAFRDIVEGDFVPFTPKDFSPIQNDISGYMLSKTYLDRLKNFVPDQRFAQRVQLARAHQMLNTTLSKKPEDTSYWYTDNTIRYMPGLDSRANIAHEFGHSLFNSDFKGTNANSALFLNQAEKNAILKNLNIEGINKLINEENLSIGNDSHYNPWVKHPELTGDASINVAVNETYGDLTGIRQLLKDNGITKKFGDSITPEMWQKALKNPKINKEPTFKRMKIKYNDDAIIKMNNEVAKNDAVIPNPNIEELIPIAQDGARVDVLSRGVYDTYDPTRPDWKGGDPKSLKFRLEHGPYWKKLHEDAISMSQSEFIDKYLPSTTLGTYKEKIKYLKEQYKVSKDDIPYTDDELTKTKNELDAYTKWEQSKQQYLEGLAAQKAAEQKKIDEERAIKQKFVGDYSSKQKALEELQNTFATKYGYTPGEQIGGDAHKMLVKKMIDEANQAIESGIGYNLFQDPKSEMTCINGVCTIAANAGVDFSQMANALGVVRDPEGRYIPQSNIGWAQNDAYKKAGFRKLAPGELPQEGDFAQYGDAGRLHHMELILGTSPEGIITFNNYQQTLNPVPGSGREQRNFRKGSLNAEDFETTQYFRLDPKTEEAIAAKSPEYIKKAEAKKKAEASDEYKQYLEYQKFLEGNKGQFEEYQKALQQKQNGGEMSFYQQGLDFTPKTISKNGSVIKDDRGQWAHPGKITEIGSNNITMKGVDYPVLGISDTGDVKLMQPGENYKFEGKKVTEFPMAQKGISKAKKKVSETISNLPIYSPDTRYQEYQDILPYWQTNIRGNQVEVDPTLNDLGTYYNTYGPSPEQTYWRSGKTYINPSKFNPYDNEGNVLEHEFYHAGYNSYDTPKFMFDLLQQTNRDPQSDAHENRFTEQLANQAIARRDVLDEFDLPLNSVISKDLSNEFLRRGMFTELRNPNAPGFKSSTREAITGNKPGAFNDVINYVAPLKKQKGGWLNKYTPKAQTGITTSIGSRTTNPTVKLTTQEDIKKSKKKAEADTKEAFAAAAKRDRQNQAYISKDKSTPASRAADQQMLIDAYIAEAQRNSPLAQTFGSLTPSGYNPEAGATAARFIGEANPIMSGVRMSRAIRNPKNNPYGIGEGEGYLSNIFGTLGLVGDVLDIGAFGNLASKGASNMVSNIDRVATKSAVSQGQKSLMDKVERSYPFRNLSHATQLGYQTISDALQGSANRKSIAKGNKWLKDWINDVDTQKKLQSQMVEGYRKSNSAVGVPKTMGTYNDYYTHLTGYNPRAAEYPLSKQFDELKESLTKADYHDPIHFDNAGISYRHGFTQEHETFPDEIFKDWILERQKGPGTWINRGMHMPQKNRVSTTIHEGAHDWLKHNILHDENLPYVTDIKNSIKPEVLNSYDDWIKSGGEGFGPGYYADPTEVHARIMEARHHFGLKPGDKVDEQSAENMLKLIKKGKTPINRKFGNIFKDAKSVANLFNKLPVVAPVAVGVGAAGTLGAADSEKQKNGGWLKKYK